MPLDIVIAFSGTVYNMKCDTVEHTYNRLPTQAPMPGIEGSQTLVLTLDLGMCIEQVSLTGLVNTASEGSGDPSKVDLENVAATWWVYGDSTSEMPVLQVSSSPFHVVLKSAVFRKEAGMEDRWNYNIIWLVRDHSGT